MEHFGCCHFIANLYNVRGSLEMKIFFIEKAF